MFRYVLWDFDGTLFDTYPGIVKSFMETLREEGIEGVEEEVLDLVKVSVGFAVDKYDERFGLRKDFRERFNLRDEYIDEVDRRPYPYAREVCQAVKDMGGGNFLITHRGESTIRYLRYYNMDNLFEEIVTRDYGFKRKPDPEAFLYVLNKKRIDRKNALGVGDRELDIVAAQNAGISTCLFKNHNIHSTVKADYTITSLEELLKILGS